jgi:hypothetical protein
MIVQRPGAPMTRFLTVLFSCGVSSHEAQWHANRAIIATHA